LARVYWARFSVLTPSLSPQLCPHTPAPRPSPQNRGTDPHPACSVHGGTDSHPSLSPSLYPHQASDLLCSLHVRTPITPCPSLFAPSPCPSLSAPSPCPLSPSPRLRSALPFPGHPTASRARRRCCRPCRPGAGAGCSAGSRHRRSRWRGCCGGGGGGDVRNPGADGRRIAGAPARARTACLRRRARARIRWCAVWSCVSPAKQ
jgi:hypothetical protein